jgi:hypothetical protein
MALFNVAVHRLNAMRAGGRLVVDAAMTDQGVVVKLGNDVPDMRDGNPGYRYSCSALSNGSATDLLVARALLESQGGAMDIESSNDNSTVFILRLPPVPLSPTLSRQGREGFEDLGSKSPSPPAGQGNT